MERVRHNVKIFAAAVLVSAAIAACVVSDIGVAKYRWFIVHLVVFAIVSIISYNVTLRLLVKWERQDRDS